MKKSYFGYGFYTVNKYNIAIDININNDDIKIKNIYPLSHEYAKITHVFYLSIGYNEKQAIIPLSINIYNLDTDIINKIKETSWHEFGLTNFEFYVCVYAPYDGKYHIVSISADHINKILPKSKL